MVFERGKPSREKEGEGGKIESRYDKPINCNRNRCSLCRPRRSSNFGSNKITRVESFILDNIRFKVAQVRSFL